MGLDHQLWKQHAGAISGRRDELGAGAAGMLPVISVALRLVGLPAQTGFEEAVAVAELTPPNGAFTVILTDEVAVQVPSTPEIK